MTVFLVQKILVEVLTTCYRRSNKFFKSLMPAALRDLTKKTFLTSYNAMRETITPPCGLPKLMLANEQIFRPGRTSPLKPQKSVSL